MVFVTIVVAVFVLHHRSTSVSSAQRRIPTVGGTQRSNIGLSLFIAPLGTHGLRRAPHQPQQRCQPHDESSGCVWPWHEGHSDGGAGDESRPGVHQQDGPALRPRRSHLGDLGVRIMQAKKEEAAARKVEEEDAKKLAAEDALKAQERALQKAQEVGV